MHPKNKVWHLWYFMLPKRRFWNDAYMQGPIEAHDQCRVIVDHTTN